MAERRLWWRDGVLYQIYPRSFADSDGDGIGDLRGIIARLDHLEWLGVDGIWLNPTMPSPNDDWGYDVADYTAVHPDLGTLEDLDDADRGGRRARASACCSTSSPTTRSDRHAWFVGRARRPRRASTATSTSGPTRRRTAGRRTTGELELRRRGLDARRGPAASTTCTTSCPPSPTSTGGTTRCGDAFDEILRFWFDRGIAGFRIDVMPRDRQGPRAARRPGGHARRPSARSSARGCQPGVLDEPPRGPRRAAPLARPSPTRRGPAARSSSARPTCSTSTQLMPFYGNGRGRAEPRVQLPVRARAARGGARCARSSRASRRSCRAASWPVWTGSNHDAGRLATRWAGDDPARARAGAADAADAARHAVPLLRRRDRAARRAARSRRPRWTRSPRRTGDPARQPRRVPHADARGAPSPAAASPTAGVEPWLPFGDTRRPQRRRPARRRRLDAALHARPDRAAPRDARPDARAPTRRCPRPAARGRGGAATGHAVALNLSDAEVVVDGRRRARSRSRPTGRATARRSTGTLALGAVRRAWSSPADGVEALEPLLSDGGLGLRVDAAA